MRRPLAIVAGALLLLATGAAAMEPPPPNPRNAGPRPEASDVAAPPTSPRDEEASAGLRAFPPPAPGVSLPPPNPRRGLAAVASALPPQDEPAVAVPGVRLPPARPSRIPAPTGHGLMLIGIYGSEDRPRALLRLPSGAVHRAAVGQTVAGVTVMRISKGVVSVRAGSRESTLTMP